MRGKLSRACGGPITSVFCFNEARANCAGNWRTTRRDTRRGRCFNEARANCAGNLHVVSEPSRSCVASMRPAQIAREIPKMEAAGIQQDMASMRPAQIAREIGGGDARARPDRFASMRPAQIAREIYHAPHPRAWICDQASMRPAQIAREIEQVKQPHRQHPVASMRPAQIAREILSPPALRRRKTNGFNEARANCAGNCVSVLAVHMVDARLQ